MKQKNARPKSPAPQEVIDSIEKEYREVIKPYLDEVEKSLVVYPSKPRCKEV